MKRYCKHIDITDWQTCLPWVYNCVSRHKNKKNFAKLLCTVGGLTNWEYFCVVHYHEQEPLFKACENIAKEACRRIVDKELNLPPVSMKEMLDKSSGKIRLIGHESAMQQVFDYIARYSCEEIWNKRIVPQQVSSIKGKGQAAGVKIIEKWITTENKCASYNKRHHLKVYNKRTKYYVKLDVTKCFPSLRLETFFKFFERDCANKDIFWLWKMLLESHRVQGYEGFMIGALISEAAAQYLLSFLYRFALSLHANSRRGKKPPKKIHKALYFMDDQLYFSSNRAHLKSAVKQIIKYAKEELGITIKPDWHIYDINETPVDIMGFVFFAEGRISLRKRIFIRLRRMALRYNKKRKMNLAQAKRILAYKGYCYPNFKRKHCIHIKTDTLKIKQKYHLNRLFKVARNLVSKEVRRNRLPETF